MIKMALFLFKAERAEFFQCYIPYHYPLQHVLLTSDIIIPLFQNFF